MDGNMVPQSTIALSNPSSTANSVALWIEPTGQRDRSLKANGARGFRSSDGVPSSPDLSAVRLLTPRSQSLQGNIHFDLPLLTWLQAQLRKTLKLRRRLVGAVRLNYIQLHYVSAGTRPGVGYSQPNRDRVADPLYMQPAQLERRIGEPTPCHHR
jgi:hypothetical protein